MKKFVRGDWRFYSKLGRGRKKKQIYRKAKGRHNKIRKKRKGYPILVKIGFKKKRKEIKKRIIFNIKDLEKAVKGEILILVKVGRKKKIEIAKKAGEMGIKISNLNINKLLKEKKK